MAKQHFRGPPKGGYNKRKGSHRVKPRKQPAPTVDPQAPPVRFQDLEIADATKAAVEAMGFTEATPIQGATIPHVLAGRDIIGQAQTGTGKTAAFGIPLIEAARAGRRGLVLAPTRELAKQVQQELQAISKGSPVEAICIVGGAPFKDQVRALQRHPQAIIVATPGRVVDHLGRGTMDLGDVALFVLDEADEMLSMGFQDELDAIVETLPAERQTILFSATMAAGVERLAKKTLKDPVTLRVAYGAAPNIRQFYAELAGRKRVDAIERILQADGPQSTLLFGRTRARVDELVDALRPLGAEALHGGMGQPVRESVMRRFRDGKSRLLVATDVAARGIDVETIDLVLHDDVPGDLDTYIHRIGRTARAGRSGTSIVMVAPGKAGRVRRFEQVAGIIKPYKVPDDQAVAAARARRLAEQLQEVEPGGGARSAYAELTKCGFGADEIALRLLESMLQRPATKQPAATGTVGLALKVGSMDKVHPGSIVGVLVNAGGLQASDIGRIDILEKMSVAEVPADQIDAVCGLLARVRLSGRPLMPREAEDWTFKAPAR